MKVTTTSKKFTINVRDMLRGLIVAVITPIITIVSTSIGEGTLTFDWKAIGLTALSAAVAYLGKNFFSPSSIEIEAPTETVQAVKEGEAQVIVSQPSLNPPFESTE